MNNRISELNQRIEFVRQQIQSVQKLLIDLQREEAHLKYLVEEELVGTSADDRASNG